MGCTTRGLNCELFHMISCKSGRPRQEHRGRTATLLPASGKYLPYFPLTTHLAVSSRREAVDRVRKISLVSQNYAPCDLLLLGVDTFLRCIILTKARGRGDLQTARTHAEDKTRTTSRGHGEYQGEHLARASIFLVQSVSSYVSRDGGY